MFVGVTSILKLGLEEEEMTGSHFPVRLNLLFSAMLSSVSGSLRRCSLDHCSYPLEAEVVIA